MNLNRRKFLKFILVVAGVLTIGKMFGFNWAKAVWTEPGSAPPGGNVATPLNEGGTAQTKTGNLTINPGTLHAQNRLRIPVGTNMFS